MKTPRELGDDLAKKICIQAPDALKFLDVSIAKDIAELIALARAEGYKAGVRARDEWASGKDVDAARDHALDVLGIDRDVLDKAKL